MKMIKDICKGLLVGLMCGVLGACLGAGIIELFIEPFVLDNKERMMQEYNKYIQHQDSLINQLRADKDSLRITRTEFDEAVKLLNEKK